MIYCPLINKSLSIDVCPLKKCMWRTVDGQCKYTDKPLTVAEYCTLMCKTPISDEQIERIKNKVTENVYENIKHQ